MSSQSKSPGDSRAAATSVRSHQTSVGRAPIPLPDQVLPIQGPCTPSEENHSQIPFAPALRTSDSTHHPVGYSTFAVTRAHLILKLFAGVRGGIVFGSRAAAIESRRFLQRDESGIKSLHESPEGDRIEDAHI